MRFHSVELTDFRAQRRGTLKLTGPDAKPVQVMALIGPNGSGKTAWLDAIAGFFTQLAPAYEGSQLRPDDVREGRGLSSIAVAWDDHPAHTPFKGELSVTGRGHAAHGRWEPVGDEDFHRAKALWARMAEHERAPSAVLVYLDANRFVPSVFVSGPDAAKALRHRMSNALAPSVQPIPLQHAPHIEWRFGALRQWIVNLEFARARAKADRDEYLPAWEHLLHVLNRLLAPCRFERVSDDFEVLFRTPTGTVPMERLSGGYQSVLVILTELLMRLSLATAEGGNPFDIEAVCLIDEIDAKLHPTWQERIMDELRWAFPRVQFIVTTHSEYVVSSLQPHEVTRLEQVSA